MPADTASSPRRNLRLAAALVIAPAILFYAILLAFATNLPNNDDYDAGLAYLNHNVQIPTLAGKLSFLLAAQQNEYKIVFGHAVIWLQDAFFGNLNNLKLTCLLGNLFVIPLAFLLWKMFLPRQSDLTRRLLLFAPVALLIFQLNYVETLNWALPCLQNVNVVFFALASIYLLKKPSLGSFWGAVAMLLLAISASGNGFLVVPVGILMLLVERRYARLALWLTATAICLTGYAYHYNPMSSQSPVHHSVLQTILHMKPVYIFAFLGAAAFLPKATSLLLGAALIVYFAWMARRGYYRRNPLVCYCILFLLLTAVGVAGIRSEFGLLQATTSRYRMYCDLMLVFVWFSWVEEFLQHQSAPLNQNRFFTRTLTACCVFALLMDTWGVLSLNKRDHKFTHQVSLFEHSDMAGTPVLPPTVAATWDGWDLHARDVLIESIRLGTYQPPVIP